MTSGQCQIPQRAPPKSLPKTGPSLPLRYGYITPLQPASSPRLGRICEMGRNVRDIMVITVTIAYGFKEEVSIRALVSSGSIARYAFRLISNESLLRRKKIPAPIQLKIWGPMRDAMKYLNLNFGFHPSFLKGRPDTSTAIRGISIAITLNSKRHKSVWPFL